MSDLIAITNPQAAAARSVPARLVDAVEKELADVADVVSPPATTTAGPFLFWRLGGRIRRGHVTPWRGNCSRRGLVAMSGARGETS